MGLAVDLASVALGLVRIRRSTKVLLGTLFRRTQRIFDEITRRLRNLRIGPLLGLAKHEGTVQLVLLAPLLP